jgi:phosphodiesterase/alkaline phosphatase D-like protein
MSPNIVLGPLLRYAGASDATVWVETDASCEVDVLVDGSSHRSYTFSVEDHHYALIRITGLKPGSSYEYSVALNDERAWPEVGDPFPPPVIRTIVPEGGLTLAFGSCRVSVPHEGPYTLKKSEDRRGQGWDALYALALRMQREPEEKWPDALLLLGDQIYADEVSMGTREFIRSRRDTEVLPGEEMAKFITRSRDPGRSSSSCPYSPKCLEGRCSRKFGCRILHSPGPTPSPAHAEYMLYLLHNGVGTSYLTSSGHSPCCGAG